MCHRRGVGRVRHLTKRDLWIQDKVDKKEIILRRVASAENEADLGTKYLEAEKIQRFLRQMNMVVKGS